ncbi:MAG: HAD family hydrolase [Candidatus Omnitrophota bacterium]
MNQNPSQKIIFLDRDGVINNYPGDGNYVTSWENFIFIPGSLEAIRKLSNADYLIFIISNQAGVTKGIYPKKELERITKNMLNEITNEGGKIKEVLYCIHREEEKCLCRKPNIGLIKQALELLNEKVDLNKIFLIGDDIRDVHTAKNSGCKSILVLSGRENIDNKDSWIIQPDYIFKDLLEAVNFILNQK